MPAQSRAVSASSAPGTTVGHRPTIAVVVNFNSGEALTDCVQQLAMLLTRGMLSQFVILDNASTDGSFHASEIARLGGTPIQTGSNLGFAAAVNQGLRVTATADALLLNPDAVVTADGLVAMTNELSRDSTVGAVGGVLRREDGAFQPSLFPEPSLLWAIAHLLRLKRSRGLRRITRSRLVQARSTGVYLSRVPGEARDGDWLNGACVLLRREAISQVGDFDEGFFLFFEEIDWCRRARGCGWRMRFLPIETAVHLIGRSADSVPGVAAHARYSSMLYYFRKHHGRAASLAVRAVGATVSLVRLVSRVDDPIVARATLRAFCRR